MMRNKLAWAVILFIAVALPLARAAFDFKRLLTASSPATTQPASQPADAVDLQTVFAGKYIVGTALTMPQSPQTKESLEKQLDVTGKTPTQQIAFATVSGEVSGKDAALTRLALLGEAPDARAFEETYKQGTPLPDDVKTRYGFFAQLAESNGQPETSPTRSAVVSSAKQAFLAIAGLVVVLIGAGAIGFCLLVTAIILFALGKIRFTVDPPSEQASSAYVQGFAWYLGLMMGVSLALALLLKALKGSLSLPHGVEYAPLILAVAVGVAWPLMRGVPWRQMREDLGIHGGKSVFLEPLCGVAGYLAGMPIIALGMLTTMFIAKVSGSDVAHPVVKELAAHPIEILFLAVVFAPITEETLFRGAFVSHLRSFANPWWAAVISGVIFAAIHPQGWAAIPALGSIGFVLAMIRQWRGSLIASMTAHALNNAGAMTLVLLLSR